MALNIDLLTHSHKVIASKNREKKKQIKEVLFDEDARREFLTGFHKRKLAKTEAAKKHAIEREKKERLESRREQRRMLREKAIQNAEEVEKAYGGGDEWMDISDKAKGKQKETADEYQDDEQLATVTIVEDFDPDELIHGPPNQADARTVPNHRPAPTTPKPIADRSKKVDKSKKRKGKIRYESKDARRLERAKQRAKRAKKAELVGGKDARQKGRRSKAHSGKR